MIIGILSDSHGRAQRTARAIRLLRSLGAESLVHCGDIGGEPVLDELALATPVLCVWGNTDMEWAGPGAAEYARSRGLQLPESPPGELALDNQKRLAVFHGHEPEFERLLDSLLRSKNGTACPFRYVCYGHTHRAADDERAGVRFINPGALHRAGVYTVATLDTQRDEVSHWVVDDEMTAGGAPRRFELA